MSNQIVREDDNLVTFEVDAQRYKPNRFTMPALVLSRLELGWEEEVRLRVCSLDGGLRWAGVIRMVSGPEIDNAALNVANGERIRVVASRP
jgi:hypothetical protein